LLKKFPKFVAAVRGPLLADRGGGVNRPDVGKDRNAEIRGLLGAAVKP
jgi:hypothetical protein